MGKLILCTIGCMMSSIFLIVLPLNISLTPALHFILILLATMLAYIAGRGVAEIINERYQRVADRRFERYSWYRRMGLFDTSQFVEPTYTKQYWIVK